jgi:UDP-N-acetylglucosamine--N-acetylmuramyl-(pentapeptide) pyrophosphoryl-undecaprenol N-acetylglucosamine transferase
MIRNKKDKKLIFLTGGGTGGSVSPLLAIYDGFKKQNRSLDDRIDFIWIGSKYGIEKEMVEKNDIPYIPIYSGKLRRYFSWKNFADIINIKLGFFQCIFLICKYRPDLILTAGSFISVPVVWAGWMMRVPTIMHQQDFRPGLANKLMSPFANIITVTFEKSLHDYGKKALWFGNFSRISRSSNASMDKTSIKQKYGIKNHLPVIFITGGGTGAEAINSLVSESIEKLTQFANIIHLTGYGKGESAGWHENYFPFKFFTGEQMLENYLIADLVISRAGLSTLTELSILGKPSIIIPMPDSHQEENAKVFNDAKAALVLKQSGLNFEKFQSAIIGLLNDEKFRSDLSINIKSVMKPDANEKITELITTTLKK